MENNSYTTIYGSEKTFTVTGKAALDNASISYAVKDGSEKGPDGKTADVVSVDSTGEVTIKQAGEAPLPLRRLIRTMSRRLCRVHRDGE